MNDIEYTGEAPSLEDLITVLLGIRINERNKQRAVDVAGHLIKSILGNKFDKLPTWQQKLLVKPSSERLWNYMQKGKDLGLTNKQIAKEAIAEELKILTKTLAPKK